MFRITGMRVSVILGAVLLLSSAVAFASADKLFKAAKRGETTKVIEILDSGVDVNSADRKKRTALMFASEKGHLETVDALLEAGADPNLQNTKYRSAARLASDEGHASVVERLRFAIVSESNVEGPIVDFIEDYPGGQYTDAANERLHKVRWTTASEQDESVAYTAFIETYPDSKYVPDANARLEALSWSSLTTSQESTSQDYQTFLVTYPETAHAAEAQEKIEYLEDRESRMSADGRIRIGEPSTVSSNGMNKLLAEVESLIQPLTLAQLAGDEIPHGQPEEGGMSVGFGGVSMGSTSQERDDGTTVMAMSARKGGATRPSSVGVWHLPPGTSGMSAMFGGSSGKIVVRLGNAFEDDSNPFRFKSVSTYTDDQQLEYTFENGVWTLQRYEKTEE